MFSCVGRTKFSLLKNNNNNNKQHSILFNKPQINIFQAQRERFYTDYSGDFELEEQPTQRKPFNRSKYPKQNYQQNFQEAPKQNYNNNFTNKSKEPSHYEEVEGQSEAGKPTSQCVNKTIMIGWIGAEPEIKTYNESLRILNFPLVLNYSTKVNGQYVQKKDWHKIVVNNQNTVTYCENNLKVGQQVYVDGALSKYVYTDQNGVKRSSYSIRANDIKIMYNPRPKEGFGERQQNQQPYQNNNNNEWSAGEDDGDVVM